MIIIDTKSSDKYFILSYIDGKPFASIGKKYNDLEDVIKLVGEENIKEVI